MCFLEKINWADFLPNLIIAIISVIAALGLYDKQKKEAQEESDKKKKSDYNDDYLYFKSLLEKAVSIISLQVTNYENYLKTLKDDELTLHQLEIQKVDNIERIYKMDNNKLFHAYLSQFENENKDQVIKRFVDIFNELDYFYKQYYNIIDIKTKLDLYYNSNQDKFEHLMKFTLTDKVNIFCNTHREDEDYKKAIAKIIVYYDLYQKEPDMTLKKAFNMLIEKLIEVLEPFKEDDNDELIDLFNMCIKLHFIAGGIIGKGKAVYSEIDIINKELKNTENNFKTLMR